MKATIKAMLENISSSYTDELIEILIEETSNEIKRLRHCDNISDYNSLICKIVRFKLNILGKEGISTENYSGGSFSYEYPEDILRELNSIRKVRFI